MKQGKPVLWTQEDSVRVHQAITAAFQKPHTFKPGDLIQSRRHFASWEGHQPGEPAALSVLAAVADLASITGNAIDKGVPGIMFADIGPASEKVQTFYSQAWHFEPYTGPMPPDAH